MNGHTEGPWEFCSDKTGLFQSDGEGKRILGVLCKKCVDDIDNGFLLDDEIDQAPSDADVRLIAASPELLATLEDVLSIIQNQAEYSYGPTPEDEDYAFFALSWISAMESDIKSAISKAKGE